MKLIKLTAACMAAACLHTGCSTVNEKNIKAGASWAKSYYNQPNMAEVLKISGTNVTWKIENATEIVLSTPVPPKSVIPANPQWYDGLYDTLRTVAPYVFLGWAVSDGGLGSRSSTTVNNAAPAAQ